MHPWNNITLDMGWYLFDYKESFTIPTFSSNQSSLFQDFDNLTEVQVFGFLTFLHFLISLFEDVWFTWIEFSINTSDDVISRTCCYLSFQCSYMDIIS